MFSKRTLSALSLVAFVLIAVCSGRSAFAQDIDYSVNITPILNLTIPTDTISLNLNPNLKTFASQDLPVSVRTNNAWGYNLSVSSTGTSLVNTSDNTKTIATLPELEGGYDDTTFPANKWGYKIGSGNYIPYESGVTLLESQAPTSGDSANLNFAAKIDYDQAPGDYNLALNFQLVAGVEPVVYMQDFTVTEAASMVAGDTATLRDSRDGQDYTVAKLADGNVWMTQNLNLAGGTTLTSATSNVSAGCNLGSNCTLPASSTSGFSNDSTAYVYNSGRTDCSSPGCYSYYSYVAATAGTNPSSGNATSDICPKGWRLPTQAEFNTLKSSYSTGSALTGSPFLAVYGGLYYSSSFNTGGSYGYYWSSTAYDSSGAYRLYFDSSSAGVVNGNKRAGFSVRCVKDMGPAMQSITTSDVNNMNNGDTLDVVDSRDGKSYTTAKINGLLWMTKNLDLAGGTTLTPSDSNVSSNYTLPASSNDSASFSDDSTAYVYNSGSITCGDNSPCYSYYSYLAATTSTDPFYYGEATSDICPKGWRLPSYDEFSTLTSTYTTGDALTASSFLGVYGGRYYRGKFSSGGTAGSYWTSMSTTLMVFDAQSADVSGGYVPRYGCSVRCVKS